MKLTLIRHGMTYGNKYGLYYGATDLPLLEEGIAELRQRKLTHIYPTATRYYASPLQRTQQTLREIYGDVPFTVVDGLREMNFGVLRCARWKICGRMRNLWRGTGMWSAMFVPAARALRRYMPGRWRPSRRFSVPVRMPCV